MRSTKANVTDPAIGARIHISSPDVGALEESYILDAVRSGWIAPLGPQVDAFEDALAARCERAHAVALSSGTAALHLALLELGCSAGTVVLVHIERQAHLRKRPLVGLRAQSSRTGPRRVCNFPQGLPRPVK